MNPCIFKVIGKADIDNDPRSKASHNALKGILAHIANCSSRLVNFSYTTPWNEPFFVPNDIWLELSTSKHLEALDSTILLDRQPVSACFRRRNACTDAITLTAQKALCAFTFHRLWKLRLAVSVTDTLQRDWDAATAGDQMFLSFLQRHSGLEALLLIYESPATIINMSSLDLPDLDLFSLDLRGYDTSRISHQLLFQPIFVNNHPNLRSIALPVQKTG